MILIMNIIYKLDNVDITGVYFSDKKKNMLMEGSFTKLLYSDEYITTIGLYVQCPFKSHAKSILSNKCFLTMKPHENGDLVQKIKSIESFLMSYYVQYTQTTKHPTYLLSEKLDSGNIKYYSKVNNINKSNHIVLKISGIWESDQECGITFKFIQMKQIT